MRLQSVVSNVLAGAALCVVMAACGSRSDKSGGDAALTTLRMATIEDKGAPFTENVEEFARQVEDLSGGKLRVKIVWGAEVALLGAPGPRPEQDVAALIQKGELDLGLIPARAWDELGVSSLQALQAPFLVSTEELVEDVLQSEVA